MHEPTDEISDEIAEDATDEVEAESPDEGFIKGYAEDDDVSECAECGAAVKEEKKIVKEFEGESFAFCSKECAKEFEESMS